MKVQLPVEVIYDEKGRPAAAIAKDIESIAKATASANTQSAAWSEQQQKAAQRMNGMHEAALKMNNSMSGLNDEAGILAGNMRLAGETLETAAKSAGLNVPALGAIGAAADVAAIGYKGLTTSAVAFNAASLGIVGAGLAIGGAIGTFINSFKAARDAIDDFLGPWNALLISMKGEGGAGRGAFTAEEAAKIRESFARTQKASVAIQQETIRNAVAQGKSIEDVAKIYDMATKAGISFEQASARYYASAEVNVEKYIGKLREQEAEQKRQSAAIKAWAEDVKTAYADAQLSIEKLMATAKPSSAPEGTTLMGGGLLTNLPEPPKIDPNPANDYAAALAAGRQHLFDIGVIGPKAVGDTNAGLKTATETTFDWSQILADVNNLFGLLGIEAGSALSSVLGGITGVMSSLQNLGKAGIKNVGGFFNALKGGAGVTAMGGAIVSAITIGASVVGAVKNIFKKPEFKKVMSDVGRDWGVDISEGLAKEIEATAKAEGLGRFEAALLHTSDIISESGRDAREFTDEIDQLFTVTANGSVPAAEGIAQLGESFGLVADAAIKAGSVGDQALVGMIRRAKELGLAIPEMQEFIRDALSGAAAGVSTAFGEGGIQMVTEEDAENQAAIFSAVFWANVQENGLIAAADAMKPAFEQMTERLKEAGIDPKLLFGDVMAQMNLAANEQFRGAAEGAAGMKQALEGLANSGYLTADSFYKFGQQAHAAFEQAKAGGADQRQALQAILPLLASMQSAASNYGIELDATTADLIEQAKAAGLAFPTDPVVALTEAIKELSAAITGVPNEINIRTNYSDGGGPPMAGGPAGFREGEPYPEFAGGGVMSKTGWAFLHGSPAAPEYVFTAEQIRTLKAGTSTSSSSSQDNRISFMVDARGASDPMAVEAAVERAVTRAMERGTNRRMRAALREGI